MAAVPDGESTVMGDGRSDIVIFIGCLGQGGQYIHRGQKGCSFQNPGSFLVDLIPYFAEESVFQGCSLVLGPQNFSFDLLELFGDKPFGVHQGLLAHIVVRNLRGLGLGDFDEVAEHLVIFDFKGGKTCLLLLLGHGPGHPGSAVTGDHQEVVQFGIVTLPDESSFVEMVGGILSDGGVDEAGKGVKLSYSLCIHGPGSKGRGGEVLELGKEIRQVHQGSFQGGQIPGVAVPHGNSAAQPFKVINSLEAGADFLPFPWLFQNFRHCIQPPDYGISVHQGIAYPLLEKTSPHGCNGFVNYPQEGASLILGLDIFKEFQVFA